MDELARSLLETAYLRCLAYGYPSGAQIVDWEDSLQTATLEMLESPPARISPNYLFARAKSRQVDAYRKKTPLLLCTSLPAKQNHPSGQEGILACIRRQLSSLLAQTITTWIHQDFCYQATADELGIAPSTVRKRIQRVRAIARAANSRTPTRHLQPAPNQASRRP